MQAAAAAAAVVLIVGRRLCIPCRCAMGVAAFNQQLVLSTCEA